MVTPEIYKKVTDEIEARRLAALAEAEARNLRLRAENEKIRQIDAELTATGLKLFRAACAGEDIAPLRERNQKLCAERRDVLLSLGLPADYTEPHYACPACQDTGFVDTKMCSCLKKQLAVENVRTSGIGNLIEKQSFENFDLERYKKDGKETYDTMKKVVTVCRAFADGFGNGVRNLLFCGSTGTGKTHLSTAIAKVVIEKGYGVLYDSAPNIMTAFENDHFRSGYGKAEPESDKYMECDLLIIDDLGCEFQSQFTASALYNLINTRSNKGLPTLISTNFDYTQIQEQYKGRIASRLLGTDYTVLPFCGSDYRIRR